MSGVCSGSLRINYEILLSFVQHTIWSEHMSAIGQRLPITKQAYQTEARHRFKCEIHSVSHYQSSNSVTG